MVSLGALLLLAGGAAFDEQLYIREVLELNAGVASNRPVDGLDYFADSGVLLLGLRYATPAGFHAAMQFIGGEGDGVLLPESRLELLESAAGWAFNFGEHTWSFDLQDYRQHQPGYRALDYQGAALLYDYRNFSLEIGFERDRPFYFWPLDRYFEYHTRRRVLAWNFPFGNRARLQLAAGQHDIEQIDIRYEAVALRFDWRWRQYDFWLAVSRASDDVEAFYSDAAELGSFNLGISRSFSID